MKSMRDQFRLSAKHPVLRDHLVHGRHVLPGVAYVDLIYQAFREQGFDHRGWSLRNVSIYRPLSVAHDEDILIDLEGRRASNDTWRIDIYGGEGRVRQRYCSAQMSSIEPVTFTQRLDLAALFASDAQRTSLGHIYEQCRAHQLVHAGFMKPKGYRYATAEAIYVDCAIDEAFAHEGLELMFHPALLDGCAIGVGSIVERPAGEGPLPLFLPLLMKSFRASQLLQHRCIARIRLDSIKMQRELCTLTLELFDASGAKVAELAELTTKVLREASHINPAGVSATKPVSRPVRKSATGGNLPVDRLRQEVQQFLLGIVAQRLDTGAEEIDPSAGYYDLGLDSAGLLELVQLIERRLQVSLSPTLLFEHANIRDLAEFLIASYAAQWRSDAEPRKAVEEPAQPTVIADRRAHASKSGAAAGEEQDIAIVGMAGRFPQAADLRELWSNLLAAKDCISEVPASRWDWRLLAEVKSVSGKDMSRWGGFITDAECFDAEFFRIVPRDAETMDPQERHFLEVAWEAIEDAGYTPATLVAASEDDRRRLVGVFAGAMHKDYALVGAQRLYERQVVPLSLSAGMIANRVSYFCNFHGPSITVDTVCSSSLTAVHLALESVRHGECDVALAGGVNLSLHPAKYLTYGMADMHSNDGRCRSFGEGGDGYVSSEGVGVIVLKQRRKAVADGDHIYAVIKGSAVNHVGAVSGVSVPSPTAQAEMISQCLRKTGIDARTISYVEAHGTGTSLGDPIEIEGLSKAFRQHTQDTQFCAIGSLKSNIGHTEAAAGIAGLIKTALQLKHRVLVASLHSQHLNPHVDWARTPFVVQRRARKWRRPKFKENGRIVTHPRRAAISSFGATGSNAHVIMEEYRESRGEDEQVATGPALILLSARNAERLRAQAQRLLTFLAHNEVPLVDLAYTLQVGREAFDHRLAIVATDLAQLKSRLASFVESLEVRDDAEYFVGVCRRYRDATGLLSGDEDSGELVAKWLAQGKVHKLAQWWTKGLAIDWTRLYGTVAPRRVSLPGYAFAKQKYWLPDITGAPAVEVTTDGMRSALAAGVLVLTPHWTPTAAVSTSASTQGEHWVLLAGWPQEKEEAIRKQLPAARVSVLEGSGELAERFEQFGWQLLQRVQQWLQGQPREALLVQVVIRCDHEPVLYALSSVLKTARLEHPLIRGQVIGVSEDSEAAVLARQLQESAASAAAEVRYEGASRYEQSYQPLRLPGELQRPWKRNGVYLITGGAGGLGLIFAEEIARSVGAARVVLTGRSELSAAKQAGLDRLQALGLEVQYRRVDVSSAVEVERLVEEIVSRYGRLAGLVHAAGVLQDSFLLKKREAEYRAVLAPKVRGVCNLDRATRKLQLDCFVMFSSASGAHGNVGQADYAVANAFLDEYARARAQAVARGECTGRTLSIGWPLWASGGMQVDALRREELRSLGVEALDAAQGIQALYEAYSSGQAQVQVLYGTAAGRSSARELQVVEPEVAAAAVSWSPAQIHERTLQQLRRLFSEVTKLGVAQIDVNEPLESYGIDSIMIMQLNRRLDGVFSGLSKTLFYEYPTLSALCDYLVSTHAPACARWCGLSDTQATPAPATPHRAPVAPPEVQLSVAAATASAPAREAIAIIGLSGRYAQARDLEAYWENLREGRDCITQIPAERWSLDAFYDPQIESAIASGRSYSKWGGFIEGFAEFDSLFFNISPRETLNLDPQERLFLQSCWAAMEDAGYTRERFAQRHQRRVGVFAGITKTGFDLYGPELWRRGETLAPWTSFGSLANRVSYVLNLQGPSMPIDTMCSASLTAVHEACEHVLREECELAFAGGVNLYLHPVNYAMMCSSRMLSVTGRCHTFGAGGDGFVPGEGVGVILLKRLSRAEADRDHIHGIIRATSINHDGKTHGYTVPNPVAQRELIAAALKKSGLPARAISYIEAHGTGTQLGDPIEITGLTQAFEQHTADKQFCAIGSAKSNIGHCESAAGIAGLTKVLLMMKHRQLVPSLHAEQLNPNIDFASTPFLVQRERSEWRRPQVTIDGRMQEYPRIAGVSSFGAGGANAHVILEEYVPAEADHVTFEITPARPAVIVLSARSEERLKAQAQQLLHAVTSQQMTDAMLPSLAYTLQVGREAMEHRLGFAASSIHELTQQLQRYVTHDEPSDGVYRGEVKRNKEALSIFTADEELQEAIAKWLERGKYAKLLDLWVKGLAFDWTRLYPQTAPRVMPLPTYPFARERHWLDAIKSAGPDETKITAPTVAEKFAPVRRAVGKPSVSLKALSNTSEPQRSVSVAPTPVAQVEFSSPEKPQPRPTAASRAPSLETISDSLTESLAKALFIERKNIGPDDVFVELGLDSIVGVEWTHVINRSYGLALPATRLYDYSTIRELSAYIAAELSKLPQTEPVIAASPVVESSPSSKEEAPPQQPSAPEASHAFGIGLLEGIAIIGIAGRFPQARNVDEFWSNIAVGKDCVAEVPGERWAVDDFYDGSAETLGTTYCRTMGALEDVAQFDPLFFGIAPSEAYVMDPQQRLFLQACWECIEDAAIDPAMLAGKRCGVFAGCGAGDYGMGAEAASAQGLIGGSSSILAARISYFLDLRGPCLAIDTACSSSLVAIASACDSLVLGQSELAMAGGVCVLCSPAIHVTTSNAGMLSKAGRCFAFDQRADGFVPAEGVGVVLLKRLGDALRDRDQIHGVIRGWGVNQDGKTNGITAPSVKSQIALEREVYERFNIDPRGITLVEAHGTGTKLGDPIEVEALVAAFNSAQSGSSPATSYCALGSVKSNIGHALTAAAVAGVIKVLLAMRHRQLPPTPHFEHLNEHIELLDTPFYVNTDLRDWRVPSGMPRRAAVSSFGFSGTNAHCVIEEAAPVTCNRVARPAYMIVLSAKTPAQLREQALRLADHCEGNAVDCGDVSYTLLVGRRHFGHRLACIVSNVRELREKLLRWGEHAVVDGVFVGNVEGNINELPALKARGNQHISECRTARDPAAYRQRLTATAELYVQGYQLEYAKLFATDQCRRISLPTYAFARERYWLSEASSQARTGAPLSGIVDAVMSGTLDVTNAAEQLRQLAEAGDESKGDAGGQLLDSRVI